MLILIAAILVMLVSWAQLYIDRERDYQALSAVWLALLLFWLNAQANLPELGRDEEALLVWVGVALALLIAAALSRLWPRSQRFAAPLLALASFAYALALDVFRPDAYGFFPAAILGAMVLIVALRIFIRLRALDGVNPIAALALILPPAVMLYASFYKLFDRTWVLPWSYLMAAGVILFAVSQLWQSWSAVGLSAAPWRKRIALAFGLGQLLIVLSAFYHYARYF